jgi:hypothetical protein
MNKERLRVYVQMVPVLSLVGGMFLMDGFQGWLKGDGSYWIAVVIVPLALGVSAYLNKKILESIS